METILTYMETLNKKIYNHTIKARVLIFLYICLVFVYMLTHFFKKINKFTFKERIGSLI